MSQRAGRVPSQPRAVAWYLPGSADLRGCRRGEGDGVAGVTGVAGADTDVLIVGAGPSGLFAAVELARHGVRARVIERERAA